MFVSARRIMYVWILLKCWDYDTADVVGVHTTEAGAAVHKEQSPVSKGWEWEIEKHEVRNP
jgi:hypothetical protein